MIRKAFLALTLALAVAGYGWADHDGGNGGDDHGGDDRGGGQNNNNNPVAVSANRLRVPLLAGPAGMTISAEGNVDIRVEAGRQRLKVEVEADVPDGTVFNVIANGVLVGTVAARFDEGEIELETENGRLLTGGISPGTVTTVSLTDSSGAVVLQAQFGAVNGNAPAASADNIRKRGLLMPSAIGNAVNADGRFDLRVEGSRQRLKVDVDADVPDGTVFSVLANGARVGSLTVRFGEGELQLESEDGTLPSGLAAPAGITTLQVTDASGNAILSAAL